MDLIYCVPGDRIAVANEINIPGYGTFTKSGYIYSSLAGYVNVIKKGDQKTIEVVNKNENAKRVPVNGSIVTCKIITINSMQCKCSINCIDEHLLKQPFKGIIRKEDIREFDKDRVEIHNCFRPGDIVLARVTGIGENGYLLSTAENELGVVVSQSEANVPMIPISWTEMICPKTFVKENRKVAKIVATQQQADDRMDSED